MNSPKSHSRQWYSDPSSLAPESLPSSTRCAASPRKNECLRAWERRFPARTPAHTVLQTVGSEESIGQGWSESLGSRKKGVPQRNPDEPKGFRQKVPLARSVSGQAGGSAGRAAFQRAARALGRIFLEGLRSGWDLGRPWLRA